MRKRLLFSSASLAILALSASSQAGIITGVTIESVSSEIVGGFDRAAVHVVDGSGLVAGAHISSDPEGNFWDADPQGLYTPGGQPDTAPTITFDLGGIFVVNGMHVWNYNVGIGGDRWTERGVRDLTVLASTDGSSFVSLGEFIFSQAPGVSSYLGESIDLVDVSARYIRFDIHSNYSTDRGLNFGVGLSEVQFDAANAVPEPSSILLMTAGLLTLCGCRAQRRKENTWQVA